jgi:hypothetical protein
MDARLDEYLRQAQREPIYWLRAAEIHRARGEWRSLRHALARLRRLGVHVAYDERLTGGRSRNRKAMAGAS